MFTPLNALETIRSRPQMYLPFGRGDEVSFATRIVADVLCLTNKVVSAQHSGDWWIIFCEEDWISDSCSEPLETVFTSILAFPEAGVNSMRGEVLLTAFMSDVVTLTPQDVTIIKGEVSQDDPLWSVCYAMTSWKRIVAFRK